MLNKPMPEDKHKQKTRTASAPFDRANATHLLIEQARQDFADLPHVTIPKYPPDDFLKFWVERVGLPPQEFADLYAPILEGLETRMLLHRANQDTLELEIYAQTPDGFGKLREDRSFNLSDGTLHSGFTYNSTDTPRAGKAMFRKSLEAGYMMGCNEVLIESTRRGAHLWVNTFEIDSINPKYTTNMLRRLEAIQREDGISQELFQALQTLIAEGDLKTIANCAEPVPHRLSNPHYMKLYGQTNRNGEASPVTMGKYLLIDDMPKCWFGSADLENPQHCARLEDCLGEWDHPALKQRAEEFRAQSTPHTQPENIISRD